MRLEGADVEVHQDEHQGEHQVEHREEHREEHQESLQKMHTKRCLNKENKENN